MSNLFLKETEQGVEIRVKVVPGSSKTRISGTLDDMMKIKIASPPEKGKANQELITLLAKRLGVSKSQITLVKGVTNRNKVLFIEGISDIKLDL